MLSVASTLSKTQTYTQHGLVLILLSKLFCIDCSSVCRNTHSASRCKGSVVSARSRSPITRCTKPLEPRTALLLREFWGATARFYRACAEVWKVLERTHRDRISLTSFAAADRRTTNLANVHTWNRCLSLAVLHHCCVSGVPIYFYFPRVYQQLLTAVPRVAPFRPLPRPQQQQWSSKSATCTRTTLHHGYRLPVRSTVCRHLE